MLEVVIEESYLNLFTGDKWTTHTNSPPPLPPPPCTHSHMLRHTFSFSLYLSWCFNTYQLPPPPPSPQLPSLPPYTHTRKYSHTFSSSLPPSLFMFWYIPTFTPPLLPQSTFLSPTLHTYLHMFTHTHTLFLPPSLSLLVLWYPGLFLLKKVLKPLKICLL